MEVNMYTIKEVSNIMDVSEHTLRFWAKSGFFPFIKRDENNIRLFSQSDLEWVKIVKCLRSVGTENKAIKRYIDLCNIGDSTIKERFEIIKAIALYDIVICISNTICTTFFSILAGSISARRNSSTLFWDYLCCFSSM